MTALAVVLIACPCGLSLATLLAVWAAIGTAANRQVLFRSGEALERLAEIRELWLDKTGTLTTGEARVRSLLLDEETSRDDAIDIAQSLAKSSTHAFSQAIRGWHDGLRNQPEESASPNALPESIARSPVPTLRLTLPAVCQDIRVRSGLGIVAESSDFVVALGNLRLMEQCGFTIEARFQQQICDALANGDPLALVGWSGRIQAAFIFTESLRPSARKLLDWCQSNNFPVTVLTGDHASRGRRLSHELGVSVHAELLPDQKAAFVRERHRHTRVGMIGDGINDAAALTTAHVGISLGAGTDVSRDAAQVCLLNNDLSQLSFAVPLARRTVATIRRNLFWAFGYNAVGVALAAAGWLNPVIAALLMVASNAVVVRSSMRLSHVADQ